MNNLFSLLPVPGFLSSGVLIAASLLTAPLSEGSISLDFENPPYSPGDLYNQGINGLRWSGGAGRGFAVDSGIGIGGSQAVAVTSPGERNQLLLNPSSQAFSEFDGTRSLVNFQFAYRYVEAPDGPNTESFVLNLGFVNNDNYAARFSIRSDGGVTYSTAGSAARSALNADGVAYKVSDTSTWTLISGELNYEAGTYTLFVDGVEQESGLLSFFGTTNSSQIRFQNNPHAGYTPIAIDNLSLSVIPEPSSVAMLLLAGAGTGLIRLRQTSQKR